MFDFLLHHFSFSLRLRRRRKDNSIESPTTIGSLCSRSRPKLRGSTYLLQHCKRPVFCQLMIIMLGRRTKRFNLDSPEKLSPSGSCLPHPPHSAPDVFHLTYYYVMSGNKFVSKVFFPLLPTTSKKNHANIHSLIVPTRFATRRDILVSQFVRERPLLLLHSTSLS